jgi:hypothetical protein
VVQVPATHQYSIVYTRSGKVISANESVLSPTVKATITLCHVIGRLPQ